MSLFLRVIGSLGCFWFASSASFASSAHWAKYRVPTVPVKTLAASTQCHLASLLALSPRAPLLQSPSPMAAAATTALLARRPSSRIVSPSRSCNCRPPSLSSNHGKSRHSCCLLLDRVFACSRPFFSRRQACVVDALHLAILLNTQQEEHGSPLGDRHGSGSYPHTPSISCSISHLDLMCAHFRPHCQRDPADLCFEERLGGSAGSGKDSPWRDATFFWFAFISFSPS